MRIPSPLFNCQQATLLVERRADEMLPFPTCLQLWAHLRLCPQCRRYEAQSSVIARLAPLAAASGATLPAGSRARLQRVLNGAGGLSAIAPDEAATAK